MTIKVTVTDGKRTVVEKSDSPSPVDGLTQRQLEDGWRSLIKANGPAILAACKNPHPYVPD